MTGKDLVDRLKTMAENMHLCSRYYYAQEEAYKLLIEASEEIVQLREDIGTTRVPPQKNGQ